MKEADLLEHFPRLWHMAEDGSFESIRKNGLLSTTALLELYGVSGEEREKLERRHRPECVTITKKGLPDAIVRDQKPMREGPLSGCLTDGLTLADWYQILNDRVFFLALPGSTPFTAGSPGIPQPCAHGSDRRHRKSCERPP